MIFINLLQLFLSRMLQLSTSKEGSFYTFGIQHAKKPLGEQTKKKGNYAELVTSPLKMSVP